MSTIAPAARPDISWFRRVALATSILALAAGAATPAQAVIPSDVITTLVGSGVQASTGDGGPAALATLSLPRDTDVAPDGSIYITDTYANRIRKVGPGGFITAFAGTGVQGSGGDGGPARKATLALPHDVAVDPATGIVYIADANNHRIRAVGTDGVIRTVAGTGVAGYTGDGGAATSARLRNPKGVVVSGRYIVIADSKNHVIRRVNLTTGVIRTIAGTGVAGYAGDGGPATRARMDTPQRLTVDAKGVVYFTDTRNHRIRKIGASGGISTVAGTGVEGYNGDGIAATSAMLDNPRGVAVDGRTLYIADSENGRIRAVNLNTGLIRTVAGTGDKGYAGDGGPAAKAVLLNPRGLTVDDEGRLLVADVYNNRIRVITP